MPSAAARRYARAVFELARESDDLAGWSRRVDRVKVALSDEDVRRLLEDPTIPMEDRLQALDATAKGWDEQTRNLAKLLVSARRADSVRELAVEYQRLVDEAEGRVRATATTAVELQPRERNRLATELSSRLGREVRLEVEVDPSIIGGLVLRFGDRMIDSSVRTRLQQLRRRLVNA